MGRYVVLLTAVGLWLVGCATTEGPRSSAERAGTTMAQERVTFPPYQGPQRKIQVVQIRIPKADLDRYPDLAEKRVGFGLSSLLVEAVFDTGRFVLLEEKEAILKRLVEQWELTEDGILAKDPAAQDTALHAAELLLYAEIFDFAACSPIERIGLVRKKLSCVTSVGVQVRIVNTATGVYIPGSSDPTSPQGRVVHTVNTSLFGSAKQPFDQSAVGEAASRATRYALLKALQRFDQAGW